MSIFRIIKELNLTKLLVGAILLRLLVMPFYFHPDIKTINFQVSFLREGVTDIYSYLIQNRNSLPLREEFVYFPVTYYFLGGYQWLVSPLLGSDFNLWVFDASQTAQERIGVFRYLFVLKLPFLLFDLLAAFLLMSFFGSPQHKRKAFIFWLFNPFSIFIIYAFGNFDIIPATLTLCSLVLARRRQLVWAALALGVAVAFKMYPLLLLPYLVLEGRTVREKWLATVAGIVPFLATVLPFLFSDSFRQSALVSGLTTRIIFPDFGIGFGESMMLAVVFLSALFFFRLQKTGQDEDLWKYFIAVFLLLFSFIHFHIQWLLWLLPFSVILMVKKPNFGPVVMGLLCAAVTVPFLYDDKFMNVSLMEAISRLFSLLPTPFAALQKVYDPFAIQSVFHSVLAGGSLLTVWQILKEQPA